MYDIVIIGGGPAGLTSAIYARRANKSVIVLEKETFGGQITHSPKVENIAGFNSLSGNEFAEKLVDQVLFQGAEVDSCEVEKIIDNGEYKTVITDGGEYTAKAVIIATGAKHRMLGVKGEENFVGNGISFCAVCDGAFYSGKTVGVIGGGNSALQEALMLSDICKKVIIVQNLDFLTGEKKLIEQVNEKDNIQVILSSVVESFIGQDELKGIVIKNASNQTSEVYFDGLFIAIGLIPQNENFADLIDLDGRGYADSGENCLTKTKGVFVAGDCRKKDIRQVATAVSDGAIASVKACDYVDSLKK